ncbi:MAG: hypothetical protein ACKVQA_11390 [Burkholderiales bacterium]
MPFAYFDRLSAPRKRIYLRSDEIHEVPLASQESDQALLAAIAAGLQADQRREVAVVSQALLSGLAARLSVPPIEVKVLAVRPHGQWGELHGLYEPNEPPADATITVWMRTVARKQVVAYKSFVRTLLHEMCHHLDYELYQFPETFHTEGFYKRESSLFRRLHGEAPAPASPGGVGLERDVS